MKPVAVYVHIPFCPTKCGYCDFNSYAMEGEIVERTVAAIHGDILNSPWRGRPAKTIFFGGGTPTFLNPEQIARLLHAVFEVHPPQSDTEITSEANPGTVDATKFGAMKEAGFNRISLGAQSFLDSDLLALGRIHRSGEIERAVEAARTGGFENINLDLMFGLPGQSLRAWSANLERAIALSPEHLSLYCLTLEPNTAFYKRHLKGELVLPPDDDQVEMYERCLDRVVEAGYRQYEISNFSRPGKECAHNLCYWHGEEYAGYGPGAVGAMDDQDGARIRYTNLKHPDGYSAAVETGQPLAFESERLSADALRMEQIMLGLRLDEGLPLVGLPMDEAGVKKLVARGWIEHTDERITLTRSGKHFCSEVALELV